MHHWYAIPLGIIGAAFITASYLALKEGTSKSYKNAPILRSRNHEHPLLRIQGHKNPWVLYLFTPLFLFGGLGLVVLAYSVVKGPLPLSDLPNDGPYVAIDRNQAKLVPQTGAHLYHIRLTPINGDPQKMFVVSTAKPIPNGMFKMENGHPVPLDYDGAPAVRW